MKKRSTYVLMISILCCAFCNSFGQVDEGMEILEDSDDVRIKFENHYYEALKYKAIGNYSRAITELEKCQQLDANDASVAFEFSKNYYLLNKFNESRLYIDSALNLEPTNYWYLEQAKKVYLKQYEYPSAINVQQKIIEQKPSKKEDLVLIYILANEREKAQSLLDELNAAGIRSSKLRNYQNAIKNYKRNQTSSTPATTTKMSTEDLKESFSANKQFEVLKQILILEFAGGNKVELEKYSTEGMALFPAQPLVYLMHGRVLNFNEKFKEAISTLEMGMDFLIEDNMLQADFYESLSNSYLGLQQTKKAEEFRVKSNELRKNK
ncbi:tetratricopeptide repeat protein [Urechidicola vernalis]|uniref:Tetratricopeptide repeat protein n=1 Tax=Urechidicola vernalis TaxID=3075600 RepID=A0ABU2Y7L2_9FLAO|nr:hypothetical protein [Urechidicola sp. P050]MDT0554176.1 hypothetical protein [Urechidicola sp. P050]